MTISIEQARATHEGKAELQTILTMPGRKTITASSFIDPTLLEDADTPGLLAITLGCQAEAISDLIAEGWTDS